MSLENNGKNNRKGPKIEVIVEDKELGEKIIVAQFKKSFMFPESFSEEVAEVLFNFISKNSGKLMGRVKSDYRDIVFFERPLNEKPFKIKPRKQKEKFHKNHNNSKIRYTYFYKGH